MDHAYFQALGRQFVYFVRLNYIWIFKHIYLLYITIINVCSPCYCKQIEQIYTKKLVPLKIVNYMTCFKETSIYILYIKQSLGRPNLIHVLRGQLNNTNSNTTNTNTTTTTNNNNKRPKRACIRFTGLNCLVMLRFCIEQVAMFFVGSNFLQGI